MHAGGGVAAFRNDPTIPGKFVEPPGYWNSDPTWSQGDPKPNPTFVVMADMDNDRRPDLVVSNTGNDSIAVLITID